MRNYIISSIICILLSSINYASDESLGSISSQFHQMLYNSSNDSPDYFDDCGILNGNNVSGSGDVNGDGLSSIYDLIMIIDHIIEMVPLNDCGLIVADCSGDDVINILDVLIIVEMILEYSNREYTTLPTSVEFINDKNSVSFISDNNGLLAFDIIISHEFSNIDINFPKDVFIANYKTNNNLSHIIIVSLNGDQLFSASHDFQLIKADVASTQGYISNVKMSMLTYNINLGEAHPNPFNPTTSIHYNLYKETNIDLLIYNIHGRLIDVLDSGIKKRGTYTAIWNASGFPSGVYFVSFSNDEEYYTQKIVLLK